MVGNGVTNWKVDANAAEVDATYWHGLVPKELKDEIDAQGCDYGGLPLGHFPSQTCMDLYTAWDSYTQKINLYNVYGKCWGLEDELTFKMSPETNEFEMYKAGLEGVAVVGG